MGGSIRRAAPRRSRVERFWTSVSPESGRNLEPGGHDCAGEALWNVGRTGAKGLRYSGGFVRVSSSRHISASEPLSDGAVRVTGSPVQFAVSDPTYRIATAFARKAITVFSAASLEVD